MSNYAPLSVAVVTYRLKGVALPENIKLAEIYPCLECGAPAGMMCTESSDLCWRARLLSEAQWKMARKAREAARQSGHHCNGFKDEIYTGLHVLGAGAPDPDGLAQRIRWMPMEHVRMIQTVLDRV